jgi:hypothetical protein
MNLASALNACTVWCTFPFVASIKNEDEIRRQAVYLKTNGKTCIFLLLQCMIKLFPLSVIW